jgi:glucokinase
MFLAGDIGGTKTLLGLFAADGDQERPTPIEVGEFVTLDYEGLEAIVREFLQAQNVSPRKIEVACFGVAGAVTDDVARLSNVPWLVDVRAVAERSGLARCILLNDLEALGYAVAVLERNELAVLQQGVAVADGNAAVIAAGTGLGEALLHNLDGRFVPAASEGGHANFAPHDHRQIQMADTMMKVFDHVSVEHVLSGPGLVNIYQFTHDAFGSAPSFTPSTVLPRKLCSGVGAVKDPSDLPALISHAALEQRCPECVDALQMFVAIYGSEAGNLALRYVATGGVYVGGGIAPKILPALESGTFLDAFHAKGVMKDLVATIPVSVILNPDAGLIGAAVHAVAALHDE